MYLTKSKLYNAAVFKAALKEDNLDIGLFKSTLKNAHKLLLEHQHLGTSSADLIARYTWLIDQLVVKAWEFYLGDYSKTEQTELVAVGGYGRAELHPYSDVDLMILMRKDHYDEIEAPVTQFLQFLWDIGLEVGHSVRSIKDCIKEAKQDITIMTNVLEGRHLSGDSGLFASLDPKLRATRIWTADKFYSAKVAEQEARHARYQDTAYSLEPNLKESPGGLRDLQTILWIYNRHFGVRSFKEMHAQGHIDKDEYRVLIRARNALWKIRTGLHLNSDRREDRLLFDFQRELAEQFGYVDTESHLAVEQLMKRYYRTAKQIIYLNEVLLANYRVTVSKRFSLSVAKSIDNHFVVKNRLLEHRTANLFTRKPTAILELFVLMQQHQVEGIHPDTIRAIRANLAKINNQLRASPKSKKLFLEIFRGPEVSKTLSRMNAYGVLGAYLPTFGAIVGQMQHDLFHVYTVDGHTLMVIQYLEDLRNNADEFPIANDLLEKLYKPERLFIAALFHDIAKGRGGDHSVLGEKDAYRFCVDHGLSEYDSKLVSWLVANHLIMSHFSQRRDISDPDVISEFAAIVGDIEHLDNLYLLTLSDIRGTSPKVWNAWKGQLLLELYKSTAKALRRGVAQPLNELEHVEDDKNSALSKLAEQLAGKFDTQMVEQFWSTLPNDYFIRNQPYYIAWHARTLIEQNALSFPIISIRFSERLQAHMIFIYAPDSRKLLSKVTFSFDKNEISIIEAHMHSTDTGFALFTFKGVLGNDATASSEENLFYLQQQLRKLIIEPRKDQVISRRNTSRALKHFPIQPKVMFSHNHPTYTAMEVVAQDQPGLLHNVALILQRHNIKLLNAKIATFGEKAEDVFFIQRHDGSPLTDPSTKLLIENDITAALDRSI